MKLPEDQPAKTYDLNILSSLIGRCYVDELCQEDRETIQELVASISAILKLNKPVTPHADPILIDKVKNNLSRLLQLFDEHRVKAVLGQKLLNDLKKNISQVLKNLDNINDRYQFFVDLEDIEKMFEMRGLFDQGLQVANDELDDKKEQTNHPPVPEVLSIKINIEETKRLIKFVLRNIFVMPVGDDFSISLIDEPKGHHLFWNTSKDKIHYGIPADYDLATHLSFDIPHNAAHLGHLASHNRVSVDTYVDTMAERAYFESIAVLSEHQLIKLLREKSPTIAGMIDCFDEEKKHNPEELVKWILADRIFEARLRVARLLGDHFTLAGLPFEKVVKNVAEMVKLDLSTARAEVYKYYTLTGLGGIYVLGPKKMIANGIENPREGILDQDGKVIRSWRNL